MISLSITQSDAFAHKGFLNAAGLFFSIKKCPLHAKGYTTNGRAINIGKKKIEFQKTRYIHRKR
jgi:hypothetical protein